MLWNEWMSHASLIENNFSECGKHLVQCIESLICWEMHIETKPSCHGSRVPVQPPATGIHLQLRQCWSAHAAPPLCLYFKFMIKVQESSLINVNIFLIVSFFLFAAKCTSREYVASFFLRRQGLFQSGSMLHCSANEKCKRLIANCVVGRKCHAFSSYAKCSERCAYESDMRWHVCGYKFSHNGN